MKFQELPANTRASESAHSAAAQHPQAAPSSTSGPGSCAGHRGSSAWDLTNKRKKKRVGVVGTALQYSKPGILVRMRSQKETWEGGENMSVPPALQFLATV